MKKNATIVDIASALGISTATVHRALHNHDHIKTATREKVLQMARNLGYRPNRAARSLSLKRKLRVSVNTLQGTTSFWNEVRAGIESEAQSYNGAVDLEFRTYPRLGEGEEEALVAALEAESDGVILFPSRPGRLRSWMKRAAKSEIPIVCVAADVLDAGRLAAVTIDTKVSGAMAADMLGSLLPAGGKVAVTVSDFAITEHMEKLKSFEHTLKMFYPGLHLVSAIEDHDMESEAYEKCVALFRSAPDLAGIYITTEASGPVLKAARDVGCLDKLKVVATDLFPLLMDEIRSGSVVASIYQQPRVQGSMALQVLNDYLMEGHSPSTRLTLAPHLVMRGSMDMFLQRRALETDLAQARHLSHDAAVEPFSPEDRIARDA